MPLLSCPSTGTTAVASSVLNKNTKLYGPMNALDISNESTCWNSDGQADGDTDLSFVIYFHRMVLIEEIRIQFQGGFVSEECSLYTASGGGDHGGGSLSSAGSGGKGNKSLEWKELDNAYIEPENINSVQRFPLEDTNENDRVCNGIKLGFQSGTDFYGRVIIYKLEVWGEER